MSDYFFEPTDHEEAIATIKSKQPVRGDVFRGLLPELRSRAFTVAGIEQFDMLETIRDRLADLPAGGDWNALKKDLVKDISPYLVDPDADDEERAKQQKAAERRAELLIRTHGFQAYQTASYEVMDRQRDVFPFWQYQSMGDHKVRATHAALNEMVLPADSSFWEGHYPPWEWGCRCQVIPLMDMDVEEMREAEASLPLERRKVLDGQGLRDAEAGRLVRGPNEIYDLRTPREKQGDSAYHFHPGDARLTVDQIKERYSPKTWSDFERWAETAKIEGNTEDEEMAGNVWEWLTGKAKAILPADSSTSTRSAPVRDALDLKVGRSLKRTISRSLDAIDQVHDDGMLPKIELDSKTRRGNLGEFASYLGGGAIRIGVKASGPWPHLTTCHELGHFLDHSAFGGDRRFASEASPLFDVFRQAVKQSRAVDTIEKMVLSPKHREYLLSPKETWARAYAQWIAQKSGDEALKKEMASVLGSAEPYRQWEADDFAPIAAAIDAIFKEKGWL